MTKDTENKLKASKYAKDRSDFLEMIGGIAGYPVEDSFQCVAKALACIMERQTYHKAALAILAAAMWAWEEREMDEHKALEEFEKMLEAEMAGASGDKPEAAAK